MNRQHGSPYDRGESDAWYRRGYMPHYRAYNEAGRLIEDVSKDGMTEAEIAEYAAGYDEIYSDRFARKDYL